MTFAVSRTLHRRLGLVAVRSEGRDEGAPAGGAHFVLVCIDMNVATGATRTYRMDKRAMSAAETERRIIRATIELHGERFHDQITLEDIAARAGVTVQTVLRRFGSKDSLIDAAAAAGAEEVGAQRAEAPPGDVRGVVKNLFDHYEAWGPTVLRLLAQEERVPQLANITARGRTMHRESVRIAFAPDLARAANPTLLEAQLTAMTDVYMWKVLRQDLGLDREQAQTAVAGLIDAVVGTVEKP
jgi:AcrR family transcriptional regulator